MEFHNRLVRGAVVGYGIRNLGTLLRVVVCASLISFLAGCVTQSPTMPDPTPPPPIPETPPENEEGWNAITG